MISDFFNWLREFRRRVDEADNEELRNRYNYYMRKARQVAREIERRKQPNGVMSR